MRAGAALERPASDGADVHGGAAWTGALTDSQSPDEAVTPLRGVGT